MMHFERLYGPVRDVACELVPARVVAGDSLPYGATRLVNAGSRVGVRPGQAATSRRLVTDRSKALPPRLAAITASSLVGRIIETGAFAARLQLVTDRGFGMRARVIRIIDTRRPRTIKTTTEDSAAERVLSDENNLPIDVFAEGNGSDGIIVRNVPASHNIKAGDLLYTCGEEYFLPVEMRIGRVVGVRREADYPHLVTLDVRPDADLGALRNVYIVVPLAGRLDDDDARRTR